MTRKRILVVEDNQATRTLVQHTLELEGYEVLCVADGDAALGVIARAEIDLVILDVMMPGVDGYGVLRRLRQDERTYELPVLILSALDDPSSTWKGWQGGCDYFMHKPFDPETLVSVVAALIAGVAA